MNLKEIFKKIFFWKKEKEEKVPERKAESPKPVIGTKIEPRRGSSNSSINSIVKEIKISTIRAQNKSRVQPSIFPGMKKGGRSQYYQTKHFSNRGPVEPSEKEPSEKEPSEKEPSENDYYEDDVSLASLIQPSPAPDRRHRRSS